MPEFSGTILGFSYKLTAADTDDFKNQLKRKLRRYVFQSHDKNNVPKLNQHELDVVKEIFGIDTIIADIAALQTALATQIATVQGRLDDLEAFHP